MAFPRALAVGVVVASCLVLGCSTRSARHATDRRHDDEHGIATTAPADHDHAHGADHDHDVAHAHDLAIEVQDPVNPWTHLHLNNDPRNFQFAIVTDRTGGHRPGVFEDAVRKLNLLQPEFVMSVGDLIEGYTQDRAEIARQWDEFRSFTARLKMPFFYVPGNHDKSNPVMAEEWASRFGRSYYHFVYRDVLFLCLDSEDPPRAKMSDAQAEYVRRALAENEGVQWTLVFFHEPLWIYDERNARAATQSTQPVDPPSGWGKIEKLLTDDGRPYTVFVGHYHNYTKHVRNDRRYIVLASTGGASQLRGVPFGEFDHVVWVTMTDDGPLLANLLLDGIWDENVATADSRALVGALNRAARVVVQPVRVDDDRYAGGTVELKLVNDANHPLRVTANFRPHEFLSPDPYAIRDTVEPNTMRQIELKLDPRQLVRVSEMPPLLVDFVLSYDVPDGPKLELKRTHAVAVDRSLPIPRQDAPVVVDGKLDEWGELPIVAARPNQVRGDVSSWTGPDDASFRFAVRHDDQNVYVAVAVTDEQTEIRPGRRTWHQDGVEVRVDARPDPARSNNRGGNDGTDNLAVLMVPGETPDQTRFYQKRQNAPDVRAACVLSDGGYVAEVAIPAQSLDVAQQGPWKAIRLNITVNDVDDETGQPAHLYWRPDWRGDETYPGSGTFERE